MFLDERRSKNRQRTHPPIAQLVERRTVEKMISLGPWFEFESAVDMKKFSSKQNLTNIFEGYFLKIQNNFH